jgi:hypothetical protein
MDKKQVYNSKFHCKRQKTLLRISVIVCSHLQAVSVDNTATEISRTIFVNVCNLLVYQKLYRLTFLPYIALNYFYLNFCTINCILFYIQRSRGGLYVARVVKTGNLWPVVVRRTVKRPARELRRRCDVQRQLPRTCCAGVFNGFMWLCMESFGKPLLVW